MLDPGAPSCLTFILILLNEYNIDAKVPHQAPLRKQIYNITSSEQTFLLLREAEEAGGFLELIAIHFDHPKRAEHLCQVGSFITAEKLHLNTHIFPPLRRCKV